MDSGEVLLTYDTLKRSERNFNLDKEGELFQHDQFRRNSLKAVFPRVHTMTARAPYSLCLINSHDSNFRGEPFWTSLWHFNNSP